MSTKAPYKALLVCTRDSARSILAFIDATSQISARINIFCASRDEQLDEWTVRDIGNQFALPGSVESPIGS